jgi:hypothetical protein
VEQVWPFTLHLHIVISAPSSLLPLSLKAYYDGQQGSDEPKLSIVFISSDATELEAMQHFQLHASD